MRSWVLRWMICQSGLFNRRLDTHSRRDVPRMPHLKKGRSRAQVPALRPPDRAFAKSRKSARIAALQTQDVRSAAMNRTAEFVVIGAGAFGASVAYHLAAMGQRNVVLLDRFELAS